MSTDVSFVDKISSIHKAIVDVSKDLGITDNREVYSIICYLEKVILSDIQTRNRENMLPSLVDSYIKVIAESDAVKNLFRK